MIIMSLGHVPFRSAPSTDTLLGSPIALARRFRAVILLCCLFMLSACQDRDSEAQEMAGTAMEMLEQDRIAEARMAIRDAIILRDDVADYQILRGRIELAAGSLPAAYDAYESALALDPTNLEALQAVSQLGLQTGNLAASLEATETLLLLNPDDVNALLIRGLHSLFTSRIEEAEAYADRALEINSISEEATILKARVLYIDGRNERALALVDQFVREHGHSPGIDRILLEIYRSDRNVEGMERQFERLRDAFPDDYGLRLDEANFLYKTDRSERATALALDILAKPGPSRELVTDVINLWNTYAIRDFAVDDVRQIASQGNAIARYEVARYLASYGNAPAALNLAQSIRGEDRDAIAAELALQSGQRRQALDLADKVLAVDPSHCLSLVVRASARLQNGQARSALNDAQKASFQCPRDADARILAANAYDRLGDLVNARREWREGSDANPQDLRFARSYTGWLSRVGRIREATAAARRLTRSAPALVQGWDLYLQLCERADDPCVDEAMTGLDDAKTRYWIDYEPGEAPPLSLFSRLEIR